MRRRSTHDRSNPITKAKLICATLVIIFYILYASFHQPTAAAPKYPKRVRQWIQQEKWANETGARDEERSDAVRRAMHYTFWKYKEHAWGNDEILPVSGGAWNSRNGWGASVVDGSSTLAIMGLWEELSLSVDFIVEELDFSKPIGLVDPFETTIRYLGGLVSLVELVDAKVIPHNVISWEKRKKILEKAALLGTKLLPAYDTSTGMPWPRVDFARGVGQGDPPEVYEENPDKPRYDNPAIGLARAGSSILENCVLSQLTDDWEYCSKATLAWMPLVYSKWLVDAPGLIDAPIDISTGEPVARQKHWDAGHDSYYEYLIKAALLRPHSPNSKAYSNKWLQAADALRHNLSSRAAPSAEYPGSHLYMGKLESPWFLNEQSHLACFAPGNLLLGGRHLNRKDLIKLGLALLDGCRHSYNATPTGIGPESWSWIPASPYRNGSFAPTSERQLAEHSEYGFWTSDPGYRLRPEYVESLFYAWRVTADEKYREWAWDAFQAMEKHCKTAFGYAGLKDVMVTESGEGNWRDESESFWVAETLKYLYLIFDDVRVGSLDDWVYSTEGHLFKRPSSRLG
jgi:mannosyl-oligosaccharide alpha-1,2-mannosidase